MKYLEKHRNENEKKKIGDELAGIRLFSGAIKNSLRKQSLGSKC